MSTRSIRPRLVLIGAGLSCVLAATGCSVQSSGGGKSGDQSGQGTASQVAKSSSAKISSNIPRGARNVGLQRKVRLSVANGTFQAVQITGPSGAIVQGHLSGDKTHWVSTTQLQQASRYHVVGSAVDDHGLKAGYEAGFRTRQLSLDEQTFPSFVPLQGQTVGVGMPVIFRFDVPVT